MIEGMKTCGRHNCIQEDRIWTQCFHLECLKEALIARFETVNQENIARDMHVKWKQLKDVATFNEDFQRIILDIPNISVDEHD